MRYYYLIYLVLVTSCVVFYFIYSSEIFTVRKTFPTEHEDVKVNLYQNKSIKYILYWDTFHGAEDMGIGFGDEIFKQCPINTCFTTRNRNIIPVKSFDAIVFHGARFNMKNEGRPEERSLNQKYIFYSWESAYNTYIDENTIVNFYNWTMTFRTNSDVHFPYGIIQKQNTTYELPNEDFLRSKTKKIAWFVSNCQTEGAKRRLTYVKKLQKYIPVDIYGSCGNLHCPHSKRCYEMLEKNYKFYLSFENSFCPDYVTEKLFNVLEYNVVPIVMGLANYSVIAPPNSVIDVRSFPNVEELATYLNHIDSNNTKYLEFFNWKKNYIVGNNMQYMLCQLCKKLHESLEYSSYENIKNWYYNNCSFSLPLLNFKQFKRNNKLN